MSVRPLLVRGLLVGLIAGLLGFLVAQLLGERSVAQAITFESARSAAEGQAAEPELVSRTVQNTVGLLTGMVVFGVAVGGLYSLAYATGQGRLGPLGARATAAVVAVLGFLAAFLLPFLKYPANPPGVGNPDTIGRRTALYLLMILVSFVVVGGATALARQLAPRLGAWNATAVAAAAGVALMAIACTVLPPINEIPVDFPADVLWRFRLSTVVIQLTIWIATGLLFGALTERAARSGTGTAPQVRLPAVK